MNVMVKFINQVNPGGPGWKRIMNQAKSQGLTLKSQPEQWKVPIGILGMIAGTIGIYSFLMGTGLFIYGQILNASILMVVTAVCILVLKKLWPQLQ
jgi:hypothetical protein